MNRIDLGHPDAATTLRHPRCLLLPSERAFLAAEDERAMRRYAPAGRAADGTVLRLALRDALGRVRSARQRHTAYIGDGETSSGVRTYYRLDAVEAAQAVREIRTELQRRERRTDAVANVARCERILESALFDRDACAGESWRAEFVGQCYCERDAAVALLAAIDAECTGHRP